MSLFQDKVLLITGGTGSFGNAVLNRFLDTDIAQIRIFSRDEKKQDDMRRRYQNTKIKFYIGDVRNRQSIMNAMNGVDYVFHAAALKQVPSCEFFPMEAVRTNVVGTENVLDCAIECKVKRVVCLSTDKAAYPINAMGISKAMMEKVVFAKSRVAADGDTTICCTRYGNVMCSRGSVIPLFISQVKAGRDITVTDPYMTRFLMSLDDAVELVKYAFANAKQGELFIQKAPASTIADLARAVNGIFHTDNKIKIIGTRHGEKQYETLMTVEERVRAVDEGKYFRVLSDQRDLNYDKYIVDGTPELNTIEPYTSQNTTRLSVEEVQSLLLTLRYVREHVKEFLGR